MKKKSLPKIILILSLLLFIVIILFFTPQSFASEEENKATIFDQIDKILEDVDSNIGDFIKSKDKDETFLIFAEIYNYAAFYTINKWVEREAGKIASRPINKETEYALKVLEVVRDGTYGRICKNYNKIATHYEEIKRFDKAKILYKTVIREFDLNKFANCYREAEISFMNLANK